MVDERARQSRATAGRVHSTGRCSGETGDEVAFDFFPIFFRKKKIFLLELDFSERILPLVVILPASKKIHSSARRVKHNINIYTYY